MSTRCLWKRPVAWIAVLASLAAWPATAAPASCNDEPTPPRSSTPAGLWRGMTEPEFRRVAACRGWQVHWQSSDAERAANGFRRLSAGGRLFSLSLLLAGPAGQDRVVQIAETRHFDPSAHPPEANALAQDMRRRFGEFGQMPPRLSVHQRIQGLQAAPLSGQSVDKCVLPAYTLPKQAPCGTTVHFSIEIEPSTGRARQYTLFIDDYVDTAHRVALGRGDKAGGAEVGAIDNSLSALDGRLSDFERRRIADRVETTTRLLHGGTASSLRPVVIEHNLRRLAGEVQREQKGLADWQEKLLERQSAARARGQSALADPNAKIAEQKVVEHAALLAVYRKALESGRAENPAVTASMAERDRIDEHNRDALIRFNANGRQTPGKPPAAYTACLHQRLGSHFEYEDQVRCQAVDPIGRIPVPPR